MLPLHPTVALLTNRWIMLHRSTSFTALGRTGSRRREKAIRSAIGRQAQTFIPTGAPARCRELAEGRVSHMIRNLSGFAVAQRLPSTVGGGRQDS